MLVIDDRPGRKIHLVPEQPQAPSKLHVLVVRERLLVPGAGVEERLPSDQHRRTARKEQRLLGDRTAGGRRPQLGLEALRTLIEIRLPTSSRE